MKLISARFKAGHFFRKKHQVLLVLALLTGCGGEPPADSAGTEMPVPEGVTVLIELAGEQRQTIVPEELGNLENTSWGRFHVIDAEQNDLFMEVFEKADSSGLLIRAVVPGNMELHGTRDHLIIRTGPSGIPLDTDPYMDSGFMAESLWSNPLVAQETLTELMDFFKPDIVLVRMETSADVNGIVEFWNGRSSTTCLYCPPDWNGFRGFGIFCGEGVVSGTVNGMTLSGFQATVLMTAGLDWQSTGYPAMQPFTRSEME